MAEFDRAARPLLHRNLYEIRHILPLILAAKSSGPQRDLVGAAQRSYPCWPPRAQRRGLSACHHRLTDDDYRAESHKDYAPFPLPLPVLSTTCGKRNGKSASNSATDGTSKSVSTLSDPLLNPVRSQSSGLPIFRGLGSNVSRPVLLHHGLI